MKRVRFRNLRRHSRPPVTSSSLWPWWNLATKCLPPEDAILGVSVPAVDVYEDPERVVVKVEIAGMSKEAFEIYMQDGALSIAGERRLDHEQQTAETSRAERFFGRFHRIIPLPAPVESDRIAARYKDGVLTITCPKAEAVRRKQIAVEVPKAA